jgi:hypothetical protein
VWQWFCFVHPQHSKLCFLYYYWGCAKSVCSAYHLRHQLEHWVGSVCSTMDRVVKLSLYLGHKRVSS